MNTHCVWGGTDAGPPPLACSLVSAPTSPHLPPHHTPCPQETNLELGFPANLVHVIRPDSFLYNLSLLEMDTRMMEVRGGGRSRGSHITHMREGERGGNVYDGGEGGGRGHVDHTHEGGGG